MLSDWFSKLSKKVKRVILAVTVLVIVILAAYFVWSYVSTRVPTNFANARHAAWGYAQIISDAVKETSQNLQQIQELEKQGKSIEALNLLVIEGQKNASAQNAAVKLSGELETMAKEIPNIKPQKAGEAALVAISSETALIYKLVSYNNYLANLLELLRQRLTDKFYNVEQINSTIDLINLDIDSINSLNTKFVEYMKNFDNS
jgi:ATP-dependent 26S proteasome regulatory subunit